MDRPGPPSHFTPGEGRGFAGLERGEQALDRVAARRVGGDEQGEQAEQGAAAQLRGETRRVEGEAVVRRFGALGDQLLDRPVERLFGLGQRGGAAGERGASSQSVSARRRRRRARS